MQRLKTRPQFDAVMSGSTVARTAHFALHRVALHSSPQSSPSASSEPDGSARLNAPSSATLFAASAVWMGAMVPKRWAKRAVTRNTIKRQIYAVSNAFEARLPQAAHVVRLRSGFDRQVFTSATSDALRIAVRTELEQLFGRACTERAAS